MISSTFGDTSSAINWGTLLSTLVGALVGGAISWLTTRAQLKARHDELREATLDDRLGLLRALLAEITENIEAHGGDQWVPYERGVWNEAKRAVGALDEEAIRTIADAFGAATRYNGMAATEVAALRYERVVQTKFGRARKALNDAIQSLGSS